MAVQTVTKRFFIYNKAKLIVVLVISIPCLIIPKKAVAKPRVILVIPYIVLYCLKTG